MTGSLYVGFTTEPPALEEVVVYERLEADLLGVPVTFDVIGTSHHVAAPELDFHEVASCERLPGGTVHEYPLQAGVDETLSFRTDEVECETRVWTESGAELPRADPDVAYVFSERAKTAILVGENSYETFHTYPEHELTVRSETTLERR
jgi:hypothetical protein